MPFIHEKHDLGILRQDGSTTVGLMLARDKDGVPYYQIDDDEYLAQQQTQEPGYDGLPYEKLLRFGQDDWRGGAGQYIYDADSPNKYYGGDNDTAAKVLDAKYANKIILPGDIKIGSLSTSLPTLPTITDGGMETWTDANNLTNWTNSLAGGATLSQGTGADKYAGTYSAQVDSVVGGTSHIYQNLGSITAMKGHWFRVTAYVKTITAALAKIAITTDGTGGTTTESTAHTGGGAFEQLSVSVQIPSDATYIRVLCFCEAVNGRAFFDAVALTAYDNGAAYCQADFNSVRYFSAGQCLLKINANSTITFIKDMGATITCLKKFTDNNLYIALGTSTAYQYMSTAEAFTTSSAVVNTFQYFEVLHTTSPTMYGNDGTRTIRSTTNPANGGVAWSAQTTVGSSEYSITCLLATNNTLYIMKQEKPYYLDTSGNVQILTSQTEVLVNSPIVSSNGSDGRGSVEWLGRIYMPYGAEGILEYDIDSGAFSWKTIGNYVEYEYISTVVALAGDDGYLYAVTEAGSNFNIWAGRYETINGTTQWVWHHVLTTIGSHGLVYGAGISAITTAGKYLWLHGGDYGNTAIGSVMLPSHYADVANEATNFSTYLFISASYLITPFLHGGFKEDDKAYISLTLQMAHAYNANRYFEVSYQLWGTTTWTSLGNFTGSATTMTETKYFSTSTKPKGSMIRFRIQGVTNDTTITPILRSYTCTAVLFPKRRNIYRMIVRCSDELVDKDGQRLQIDAAGIRTVLNEAKDDATAPITWYDIDGTTRYGKVMPAKPFWRVTKSEKSDGWKHREDWASLTIMEVKYS